ncbi:DUF3592 domain-containing protein [Cellulomonas fimi]|uniref:DUF3592 domain-containing protein n=1 Tax=Cellulomonas fimi TaxID=1708 RepID=UPI002358D400|nr:DUF3592 domain-containing protein [Cellulomonas fimi]
MAGHPAPPRGPDEPAAGSPGTARRARVAAPSRRRPARVLATTAALVSALGLVLAVVAVFLVVRDYRFRGEAIALDTTGRTATVEHAEVTDRGTVQVRFVVAGRDVTTRPLGSNPDTTDVDGPLVVRYDPSDPQRAMLTGDVTYYVEDAMLGGVLASVLFVLPAVVTALVWRLAGRPPWWRHVAWRHGFGPTIP